MKGISDGDEDDDFVTIGTQLPLYDEDEVPVRKPVTLQDQSVRDAQGRLRFHGAFTGGFSAGYFNSVDTKEGWVPKSFKSSRSQKLDVTFSQRPEDFMDEEDFGEFGIAPKKVATTKNFSDLRGDRKRPVTDDSVFGSSFLADLVVPCRSSMGVRLLRKLGWRDGQGIGPRERHKRRRAREKSDLRRSEEPNSSKVPQKVYGCAVPAGLNRADRDGSDGQSGGEDDDDDSWEDGALSEITFAPHDICPINFDRKDNVHGLGYHGIDPSTALFRGSRMESIPVTSKKGKLGIRGQAFGVGAFEEEDDEIYGVESMSNYDIEIGDDDKKGQSSTFGWTAPKRDTEAMQTKVPIKGFTRASTSLPPKKTYPPPQLPRDFRPFHKFGSSAADGAGGQTTTKDSENKKLNAFSRGTLLGEKPHLRSVFELVSNEDRARVEAAKMQHELTKSQLPVAPPAVPLSAGLQKETLTSTASQPVGSGSEADVVSSSLKKSGAFVPFARDLSKQKRYEMFLDSLRHHKQYTHDESSGGQMTEWEKEREREEFMKAAHLFQPLSTSMASRFTRAKHDDNEQNVELPAEEEKSSKVKAAEMKMFGKLTRERLPWHPDKMVCRRFNIADPYPESTIVGLQTTKRDKCSIFNLLSFGNENPTETTEGRDDAELSKAKVESKPMKPLAILATVDLQPKPLSNENNAREMETQPESSADSMVVSDDADNRRPPIDLFKAIFEDTDSAEESSEEHQEKEVPLTSTKEQSIQEVEEPVQEVEEPVQDVEEPVQDVEKSLDEITPQEDRPSKTKTSREFLQITSPYNNTLSENGSDDSASARVKMADGCNVFGPALPPPSNNPEFNRSLEKKETKRRVSEHGSKCRHHRKTKHKKSHHKKSSSRKHKHKKKRKKKMESDPSQLSGSDADYDTESSSPSDIDRKLISKLKGFRESRT